MFSGEHYSSNAHLQSNSDLYTTLAISETEARTGTERVLNLPSGKQLSISIPPGAQNGQVIELNDPTATPGGTSGRLLLTLSVLPEQQQGNTATFSRNAPTFTGDSSTFITPASNANLTQGGGPTLASHWQGAAPATSSSSVPPAYSGPPPSSSPLTPAYPGSATQLYSGPATPAYPGSLGLSGPGPSGVPGLPPGPTRRSSGNILLISLAAALLLILGGAVLVYAIHGSGPATGGSPSPTASTNPDNSNSTATALANAGQNAQSTSTAQAQASATTNAQNAASAQSTSTAQAQAQAQANATATAVATNPYGGTLAMTDSLVDNSQGHQWDESNDPTTGTSCQFTNSAYHMVMPGNYGGACLGQATHFGNFAFQVQMTFLKYGQHFSGGGLVFRGGPGSKYYVLEIFESGQYTFFSCSGNDCSHGIAGYPAASLIPSFHLGLNTTNTIAVVANGNTFTFYANGQRFAGPFTDSTYTQGTIGFYAEGGSEGGAGATVDVAYSNVKIWQL